jgi:serine protease AprX
MARRSQRKRGKAKPTKPTHRRAPAPRSGKVAASAKVHPDTASSGSAMRKRRSRRSGRAAAGLTTAPGLEIFVGKSSALSKTIRELAKRVTFTVAPRTISNEPIQAQRGRLHERDIEDFRPRPDAVEASVERLRQLGFEISRLGRFGITASGPAQLVCDALKIRLVVQARPHRTPVRATQNFAVSYLPPRPDDLYVAPTESLTIRSTLSEHIDHLVFIPPPLFFAPPSVDVPKHSYFALDSAAIRRLLRVPDGATGAGVKVALVDSGFFRHPYYAANSLDYRPMATSSAADPEDDQVGHGTAIAYNTFSVAPGATVMGFKQTDPPQNALEDAAESGVDIISCSWGWDHEQTFPILEATIRSIVKDGKIVLFAAGNGQQAWPGSMPEVLSIGGVYADDQGQLEASNYASGYTSNLYPGRRVPDVSGLCGQRPKGIYILMPCAPGSSLDRAQAGPSFPDQDETAPDDGWLGASGTSSAAPQVAGLVALLVAQGRAKGNVLTTDAVRNLLQQTAVIVEKGNNAQGFPAVGHPNIAVGFGLVDAGAALDKV